MKKKKNVDAATKPTPQERASEATLRALKAPFRVRASHNGLFVSVHTNSHAPAHMNTHQCCSRRGGMDYFNLKQETSSRLHNTTLCKVIISCGSVDFKNQGKQEDSMVATLPCTYVLGLIRVGARFEMQPHTNTPAHT